MRKDGSRLPVHLSVTPVRDGAGVITGFMAIAADRSARLDTERALKGQKALLQASIDAMPGLYCEFDAEGRMLAWNRNYAQTLGLGYDEIRQMHALDVVHPADVACALEKIHSVLADGQMESAEIRVLARNGCVIPVLITGGRVMSEDGPTLVGTAVDLTSRVAAEAALTKSRQEVVRRNESLQLLNELSRRLHGHLEVDAICEHAIQSFMRLENTDHIAIYQLSEDGDHNHALMRSADVAMYAAKHTGQGVARYEPALDHHSPERLAMMADLDRAIRDGELLLHYQPKYDLKQGRIAGFEALVRWLHPRLGLLHPEQFLHLAEMGEAIHALTEKVLDLALADLRQWQDDGRGYGVAVNLSAQSLADERFLLALQALLRNTPSGLSGLSWRSLRPR